MIFLLTFSNKNHLQEVDRASAFYKVIRQHHENKNSIDASIRKGVESEVNILFILWGNLRIFYDGIVELHLYKIKMSVSDKIKSVSPQKPFSLWHLDCLAIKIVAQQLRYAGKLP